MNRISKAWLSKTVKKQGVIRFLIFLVCLGVYLSSLNSSIDSGDVLPNYLLTKSIVHNGEFFLDGYQKVIDQYRWPWGYATVSPDVAFSVFTTPGKLEGYHFEMSLGDASIISAYPPGASFLAILPYFFISKLFPRICIEQIALPFKIISASFAALSAVLMYRAFRQLVTKKAALLFVFLYAFCTSVWSAASQDLWQHPGSILMLSLFITLFLEGAITNRPNLVALAAFPLAFSISCRLTNGLFVLFLLIYILFFRREILIKSILFSGLGIFPFALYGLATMNVLISSGGYSGTYGHWTDMISRLWTGLLGLSISPGRGLLVYSPIFILSIFSVLQTKNKELWLFLSCSLGLLLIIAPWPMWWGGGCYSYRLVVEIVPFLSILLAWAWQRLKHIDFFRIVLLLFTLISLYVQVIGAYGFDYSWELYMRAEYDFEAFPERAHWNITQNPIRWYHRKFWTGEGTPPPTLVQANFSDKIELVSYRLGSPLVPANNRVHLTLYWQAIAPMDQSYKVFTHIIGETEHRIWGQIDNWPVNGTHPTTEWQPGEVIKDDYFIPVHKDTPPGTYWVKVGLYFVETMERLSTFDQTDNSLDTRVLLGPIHVE